MMWSRFLLALSVGLCLMVGGMNVAEAKRLGSGSSFGSKFSYSNPVQRKSPTATAPSAAQSQNMDRRQQLSQRGGLMGILGGLALGGLLGALFFGGAFEGLNLFDIVIFAGILFLLFKLMGSRRPQTVPVGHAPGDGVFSREGSAYSPGDRADVTPAQTSTFGTMSLDTLRGDIPKDFDQTAFLAGSKSCFSKLQKAWDGGDLAEIRRFTTDHVFAELQDMVRAREGASSTEVVSLQAELLKVNRVGATLEAAVLFTAEMVEDGEPASVQEVWHFVRNANSTDPNWQVEGIQQVEE